MPKLPVIKARVLLKTLQKLGFYEYHQVGSHIQLKHPDGRRIYQGIQKVGVNLLLVTIL